MANPHLLRRLAGLAPCSGPPLDLRCGPAVSRADRAQSRNRRARSNRKELAELSAYGQVLALRQGLPATAAYYIAVCHARLDHKDQALQWLQRAKDMGLHSIEDDMTVSPACASAAPTWIRQVAPYRWRNTTLLRALGIGDDDAFAVLMV